eukprot:scaffold2534_cov364-Prasinococcus_capsulatus_cf.AAC.11
MQMWGLVHERKPNRPPSRVTRADNLLFESGAQEVTPAVRSCVLLSAGVRTRLSAVYSWNQGQDTTGFGEVCAATGSTHTKHSPVSPTINPWATQHLVASTGHMAHTYSCMASHLESHQHVGKLDDGSTFAYPQKPSQERG